MSLQRAATGPYPQAKEIIYKQSLSLKKWKKKIIYLDQHLLVYHSKKDDFTRLTDKNKIPLCNITSATYRGKAGKKYLFVIETYDGYLLKFGTGSQQSSMEWVKKIHQAIVRIKMTIKDNFHVIDGRMKPAPRRKVASMKITRKEINIEMSEKSVLQEKDFRRVLVVGKGSFGTVYLVEQMNRNKYYAMKVLHKDFIRKKNQIEHTLAELEILSRVNHPFLMNLHYAFQTKSKLIFVMDFVNGGELFYHLERSGYFSEERTKFYAIEIFLALLYLHSLGIIYRDLKPENVLLRNTGHIVLTDFGLSKILTDTELTDSFCGTPEYISPEVIMGEKYSFAVDWWAFGMLIYEMRCGDPPFQGNTETAFSQILFDQIIFLDHISENCQQIVSDLTRKNFQKRFIFSTIPHPSD